MTSCCRLDLWPDPEPTSHDYANVPTLEEARADLEAGTFWIALTDVLIDALDEYKT